MASKHASLVDEWLKDDNLVLLEAWSRDGYTLSDIADRVGVHLTTLCKWRDFYPEIGEALSKGKELIDYKVENALLKSALGYTTKEIKVTIGKQVKNGKTYQITKETTVKEVAPNVTACAMWLNNRRPDRWKRNRDKVVELDEEDNNLTITVVRGPRSDERGDTMNREIQISGNKKDTKNTPHDVKAGAIKEEDDRDFWPDDWEEDDD